MAFLRQKHREQPLSLSHPENSPTNNCTHRVKARKQCHEMEMEQNRQTCECDNLPLWNSYQLKSDYGQSRPFTRQRCHLWRPDVERYIFKYYFHILSDIPAWRCVVFLKEHCGKFDQSSYLSWGGARQVLSQSCNSRVDHGNKPALLCLFK